MTQILVTLAQAQGAQQPGFMQMVPLMVIVVGIWYFLVLRPQNKQDEAKRQMQSQIKKGDEVLLKGGIHGRIYEVQPDILLVEIADKVRIKVNRDAVTGLNSGTAPKNES